jgi:hypothetical protein
MRAGEVLQKCLCGALADMHQSRSRVLMRAVDALVAGRRLTLFDLARSWPDAERMRPGLKALDRLLSNAHLHAERDGLYASMARWLIRSEHPVILVDWANLKANRRWHVLRASVPVGGRSLTLLDTVVPLEQQASPGVEQNFLRRLAQLLPAGVRPVIVTDAGFRSPWFRAVSTMGWHWIGRLRNRTQVKPVDISDEPDQWVRCKAMYALAGRRHKDLGLMHVARYAPVACRVILHARAAKGRKDVTRLGSVALNSYSRKHAEREREPWLLIASPELELTATQIVALYARRMQIELSFRDLKSQRYGQGFEDSLTRKGSRIEILLLLSALAAFACWIAGLACDATGLSAWLSPRSSHRRLYSIIRMGREALARRWPLPSVSELMQYLRRLNSASLDQMTAGA